MHIDCRPSAVALTLLGLLGCVAPALAERLPWTTYTSAQGLSGTAVNAAIEDAQGFLWLGTDHGLTRFDGLTFRDFGREHGLTKTNVSSLALTPDGTLWVGAWGGVFRFDPARGGSFVEIPFEGARFSLEGTGARLFVGPDGRLWCTSDLVYRLEPGPRFRRVAIGSIDSFSWPSAFLPDRAGNLWIAFTNILFRVDREGSVTQLGADGPAPAEIWSILELSRGRMWVGASNGLWTVEPRTSAGRQTLILRPHLSTPNQAGHVLLVASRGGGVWAGLNHELIELDSDGAVVKRITHDQGLLAAQCAPLLIDHAGDLWVSSASGGIQRLASEGFSSFGSADGLESQAVRAIWQRRTGDLVVVGTPDVLHRYDGRRFIATRPAVPAGTRTSWGWYQVDMEDRTGRWWIPTDGALVQFAPVREVEALARARPSAVYGTAGCFPGGDIFRLFEDSRGDVWIGTISRDQETIYRWNSSTGTFSCFSSERMMGEKVSPTAFVDDGSGSLWIGFYGGQIGRYRDDRFECVFDCSGTSGRVNGLFLDKRKRLWIATARRGVVRMDDATASHPDFARITTEHGLSSNRVGAVTGDRFGRIYIGTERGVDVFEESSGRIRHFGLTDGLPQLYVIVAYADHNGDLWFGTLNGLARFTPPARFRDIPPARVLVDAIRVSGVARPLSSSGEAEVAGIVLAPDQRDLVIDYVGLPRSLAGTVKFQYRLHANEPWSAPSGSRSVVLAGLAAGAYLVEIRALDAAGRPSPHTAFVSLQVLAPVYRRSWFIMAASLLLAGMAALAYRAHVRRLVALERQRTHIAMDLHDEMGSRLGSIGLLADLAREDSVEHSQRRALLEQIAETAADMGSSLTDIVWSLRPSETSLESLARHLADRGRLLFPSADQTLEIRFAEGMAHVETSLAVRRATFLIGIEALHNAARHSGARHVVLGLRPAGHRWQLEVKDDGSGDLAKEAQAGGGGFGLETMHRRADEIGAPLVIDSAPGTGTTVRLIFDPRAEDRRPRPHMNIGGIRNRIRGISWRR